MIIEELNQELREAVKKLSKERDLDIIPKDKDIEFEISDDINRAHFSSSSPLKLAKFFKTNPVELAKDISAKINHKAISKYSVEGAGFINIFINKNYISDEVKKVLKYNEEWGKKKLKKERVLVEFVSSNPTGPLHIGHARGAVLGNIISNLLSNQGHEVTKEYYVNDAGRQINILALSIMLETFQNKINKEGLYQGSYIKDLAKKFMEAKLVDEINNPLDKFSDDPDERIDQLISHYKKDSPKTWIQIRYFSVNEMIKLIKDDLLRMGILHDEWFYESSLGSIEKKGSSVTKALDELVKSKNTFEKDGAIWFEGTKYGDDKDRVLLRANKEPTYYLTDVGYHKDKIDRNYDHYINIFGADHHGYVTRLTSAFNLIKKPNQNIEHILYQLVNLYEGGRKNTMSTRKGKFLSLNDLLSEYNSDLIKFFFLEKKYDHEIDFDTKLAKENSKNNPYFYTMYAYVRSCSILEKRKPNLDKNLDKNELIKNYDLLSKIINFPIYLEKFTLERSPHSLVHFTKELAANYHSFYEQNPVITDNQEESNARLLITKATSIVLKNSFKIIGVTPLEKM
ncbi:MAG: arginine--tRNA ligase [SAR86 cluster bacterium]|nr:MAG: arginine--tRNA ligase [SAR86 cluster bacterium]|tara:strand:+ start:327 stop:2033 length:1707 start_codon:yes stop_codon:yes gene_type:complete